MTTPTPAAQAYLDALRRLLDAEEGIGALTVEQARAEADAAGLAWDAECRALDASDAGKRGKAL